MNNKIQNQLDQIEKETRKALSRYIGEPVDKIKLTKTITETLQNILPSIQYNFEIENDKIVPKDAKTAFALAMLQINMDYILIAMLLKELKDDEHELQIPNIGKLKWSPEHKHRMTYTPLQACEFIELKLTIK